MNRSSIAYGWNEKNAADDDACALLYTPAEAAERLSVKESWLRRQAGVRAVPCTFLGKHLRFSDADLRDIVRQGRRPPR
jgi:excisionase family DNA binding protein